jgi:hypothetical protein
MLTQLPEAREKEKSKTGFGQVKIMKEFVWINRERPPPTMFFKFEIKKNFLSQILIIDEQRKIW